MAHGAAIKSAWAATEREPIKVGDKVEYFQMTKPTNGGPGPGPHQAKVTAVNSDRSLHLKVKWPDKTKHTDERFVSHRGMADGARFWDYKKTK